MEYAVALLCFITAVLAMQEYITRSLQGKMRKTADSIGDQYDRTNTVSSATHTFNSGVNTRTDTIEVGGRTTTTINSRFTESESDRAAERIGP